MSGKIPAMAAALAAAMLPAAGFAAEVDQLFTFFQAEQMEYRVTDGRDSFNWDAQGWIGGDDHKA